MAKDKETYDSYAKDVFDNPPAGPVGVHRGARSAGARMTPFLIVLLVVALAGVGTWGVLSGMFSDVLFGNNGTSQAADDKASDSGDSKTGDTTKSGTGEQSTSSSTDGSSDTASNTSTDSAQSDTTSSSSDGSTDATDTNGQGTDSTASFDAAGHRRGEQGHFRPRDQRNQDLRSRRQPCVHAQAGRIQERRLRQPLRYVAREHRGLVPERDRCGDREGHRRDLGHLRRAADVGHLRTRRRRADAVTVHRPRIRVPVGFVRMSPSTVQ